MPLKRRAHLEQGHLKPSGVRSSRSMREPAFGRLRWLLETRRAEVFFVLFAGCATGGGDRGAPVERRPREDPWALPNFADAAGNRCSREGRRCPRGEVVPDCTATPAASELSAIGPALLAKIGERVTIAAKPTLGVVCTLEGCDCCNRCSGPICSAVEATTTVSSRSRSAAAAVTSI